MTERRRPIMTSLPVFATMVVAVGLLILAAIRWREHGWGASVWIAVFVLMCVIRMPHLLRNRANVVIEAHKNGTEKILLAGVFLTMMVLPLLQLATGLFAFADYQLPQWAIGTADDPSSSDHHK